MPKYHYKIVQGAPVYMRPDLRDRWLGKHEGEWFGEELIALSKHKDPKTAEQLGYYWGLLVPEIRDEFVRQEHTYPVRFAMWESQVPYDKEITHLVLSALCNRVGDDGAAVSLSDEIY